MLCLIKAAGITFVTSSEMAPFRWKIHYWGRPNEKVSWVSSLKTICPSLSMETMQKAKKVRPKFHISKYSGLQFVSLTAKSYGVNLLIVYTREWNSLKKHFVHDPTPISHKSRGLDASVVTAPSFTGKTCAHYWKHLSLGSRVLNIYYTVVQRYMGNWLGMLNVLLGAWMRVPGSWLANSIGMVERLIKQSSLHHGSLSHRYLELHRYIIIWEQGY